MTRYLRADDFFARYPDEAACLADLARRRFGARPRCPACGRTGRFARVTGRRVLACPCGHHLRPLAGTPMQGTRVPLLLWFYAAFWTAQERRVPPVRALAARLGVALPTAVRLARELRRCAPAWADASAAARAAVFDELDRLTAEIRREEGGDETGAPRRRRRRRRPAAGNVGHAGDP
jgi:hypothetical protein